VDERDFGGARGSVAPYFEAVEKGGMPSVVLVHWGTGICGTGVLKNRCGACPATSLMAACTFSFDGVSRTLHHGVYPSSLLFVHKYFRQFMPIRFRIHLREKLVQACLGLKA
jgi:hypothetical protein